MERIAANFPSLLGYVQGNKARAGPMLTGVLVLRGHLGVSADVAVEEKKVTRVENA